MTVLRRFLFDGLPVRGAVVRLTDEWRSLLQRRDGDRSHPPEVRALLGEMSAAALMMQAHVKFNGALLLQISGDGPLRLAVAEVQPDLAFRATATVVGDVPPGASLQALANVNGQGRCAITLDPRDKLPGQQPYQGVVPLAAGGAAADAARQLALSLEHYMQQSEQLATRLVLAADDSVAAGLLIQRLPVEGQANLPLRRSDDAEAVDQAFERIALLAATLTRDELLALEPEPLLHRLFWDDAVRVLDPQQPRFACSCSRERVRGMLRGLGRDESESLIAERGVVEVACEFCGRQYRFDAVDVGELFTPGRDQPPASPAVH